jgi:hypothetical protein
MKNCSKCGKKHYALGLCRNHYGQLVNGKWREAHRDEHLANRRKISRTIGAKFSHLKGHGATRRILVNLSFEDFQRLNALPCDYCKGPLPETGHGLDRKDNTRGYELDNVVPCCYDCNTMKGKFLTYEEMHLIWERRLRG